MAGEFTNFGAYRIVRRIGVGGMAETFLAVRRGPGAFEQRVCLKRVLPAFEADTRFIEQFLEEATIGASLRHSNIVSVIDFGQVDGTHFMALELVDGVDLRALVRSVSGERLSPELTILVATELAQALFYAHNQTRRGEAHGIVHRDISPANVLVSYAGEVKLADFGIAKAMCASGVTASGAVKGKVPYMSPEQARGETLDGRSDLFAVGVCMYELLCGVRPFDGDSDVQTLTRILAGEYKPISDFRTDVPGALALVIGKLLMKEASERLPSAEALLAELANLPSPPVTARLELGRLAKRARPPETLGADEMRAVLAEAGIGRPPEPTAMLTAASTPPPALVVDPAGPADATRTRLPASAPPPPKAAYDHTVPGVGNTPSGIDAVGASKRPVHSDTAERELHAAGIVTPSTVMTRPSTPGAVAAVRAAADGPTDGPVARKRMGAATVVLGALVLAAAGLWWSSRDGASPPPGSAAAAPLPAAAAPLPAAAKPPASVTPPPHAASDDAGAPKAPDAAVPSPAKQDAPEITRGVAKDHERNRDGHRRGARLRVRVSPWGMVWIDDAFMGRAPADARLSPGSHQVSAGYSQPTVHRTITVKSGENPDVLLELPTQ